MNNKHVFWEALIVAFFIFGFGIIFGIYFENLRIDKLNEFYSGFDAELSDFRTAIEFTLNRQVDCGKVNERAVFLANELYNKAMVLEKYDNANKITPDLILLHKKYDILRTFLWSKIIESNERCGRSFNTVVYLYEYKDPSLSTKGTQGAMSNFLIDLKKEYGDKIVLIPIASDLDVTSLNLIKEYYNFNKSPGILVNENQTFYTLDSLKNIPDALIK